MMMDQSLHDPCTSFDLMWNSEIEVTEGRTRNICRDLSALNGSEITEGTLRDAGFIRSYMGHDLATNAYALLCEDFPFSFCEVRCGAFGGKYETDFLDRADYSCPIYRQIDYAYAFLRRNLRVLDEVDGKCIYEVPIAAVREAIINVVQHRDYADCNRPIFIALRQDCLEIRSPGGVPSPYSVDLDKGCTYVRNPALSKVFRAASVCRGLGNGFRTMVRTCRECGLRDPISGVDRLDFTVTIFRPVSEV